MLTSREVRAARVFLGWSRQKLADKAIVSLNSIIRFEQGAVDPRSSTISAIRRVLERAGIEFLSLTTSDEEGIRVRKRQRRNRQVPASGQR
jgi:predicted transcriptional regulator